MSLEWFFFYYGGQKKHRTYEKTQKKSNFCISSWFYVTLHLENENLSYILELTVLLKDCTDLHGLGLA